MSYSNTLKIAQKYIDSEYTLSHLMNFLFNKDYRNEILIIQSRYDHELILHINELSKNLKVGLVYDYDVTIESMESISFSKNIVFVTKNASLLLKKCYWLEEIYTIYDKILLDKYIDSDFNYSESFRNKAIKNRKIIEDNRYELLVQEIIENMDHFSDKGRTTFKIILTTSFLDIANFGVCPNVNQTIENFIDKIMKDKRFYTSTFDIQITKYETVTACTELIITF
jgi:hypothetical protein